MRIKKYTYLAILLISLFSCETTIDFKGEITEPLLVVNSIAQLDSVLHVQVSQSRFFLENRSDYASLSDAKVLLFVNDNFQDTAVWNGNSFTFSYIPRMGDALKLQVNYGQEKAVAEAKICALPNVSSADTILKEVVTEPLIDFPLGYDAEDPDTIGVNKYITYGVTVWLSDSAETTDYYYVSVTAHNILKNGLFGMAYAQLLSEIDTDAGMDWLMDSGSTSPFFSDEKINGNVIPLRFNISYNEQLYFEDAAEIYRDMETDSVVCEMNVQRISYDYYLYLKTVWANAERGDYNLFSEPIQIYNNISGGIGIFGSSSSKKIKVRIK